MNHAGRHFAFILAFACIVLLCAGTLAEQAELTISASGPSNDGTVTATVRYDGDAQIAGAQFAIGYDADALELVKTQNGSVSKGGLTAVNDEQAGRVIYVWSVLAGSKPSGELLILTFKVRDGASGETAIVWDDSAIATMVIDADLNSIPCERTGAAVELGGSPANPEDTANPANPANTQTASQPEAGATPGETQAANTTAAGEGQATPSMPRPDTGITLNKGETADLAQTIGTEAGKSYVWTSSNGRVANVDENGVVTALENGESTISAISEDGTEVFDVTVSVGENTPESAEQADASVTGGPQADDSAKAGNTQIEILEGSRQNRSLLWITAGAAAVAMTAAAVWILVKKRK